MFRVSPRFVRVRRRGGSSAAVAVAVAAVLAVAVQVENASTRRCGGIVAGNEKELLFKSSIYLSDFPSALISNEGVLLEAFASVNCALKTSNKRYEKQLFL